MARAFAIDDQPMDAAFFGEGRWLTEFITPDNQQVQELYQQVTGSISDIRERITRCWQWVTSKVRYVKFVRGKLWINGESSVQNDLWQTPSLVIRTKVGNCANKSFLLTSLLRNELPADKVYCVLGNLYNGKPGGHAWVQLQLDDEDYTMESTMPTAPPLVPASTTRRYEAVHFFNDKEIFAVEGRTQLVPFTACYSTWLSDYLNWAFIEGGRR